MDVHGHLPGTAAACLTGGVALYLLTHVAFRLRNLRTLNRQRLVVAALLLLFAPFADQPPALATIALVAAVVVTLIAYEAIHFGEARRRVRESEYAGTPRVAPDASSD